MKPVDQTIFGDDGNCFAACLASVLELPIEAVDLEFKEGEHWMAAVKHFLAKYNLELIHISPSGLDDFISLVSGFYLIHGLSPRGLRHSVVGRAGEIIYDPHPSKSGLATTDTYSLFVCLDPAKARRQ